MQYARAAAGPVLEHLAQGERSVERLAERLGLPIASTSQHLLRMRRAGVLPCEGGAAPQ